MLPLNLTLLSPTTSFRDLQSLLTCRTLAGLEALTVPPILVPLAARLISATPLPLCTAVAYPLGLSKPTLKAIEATSALKDGVAELLVTPHLPHVLSPDPSMLKAELLEIARAARSTRRDAHLRLRLDLSLAPPGTDLPALLTRTAQTTLQSAFDSLHLSSVSPDLVAVVAPLLPTECYLPTPADPLIPSLLSAGATRIASPTRPPTD